MILSKKQIITVILLLALVFSLPVVIFLTRKRQDIRPKALQGKADFLLQLVNPDDLTKSSVGKNIEVLVFLRLTDSSLKVSGVDFLLLYDKDKLDVVDRVPYISSVYPAAPFTDAPIVTSGDSYPAEDGKYNFIRISEVARRTDADLPGGTFQLAKIIFRGRSTGSATIKFPDDNSVLEISGIGISLTPTVGPSPTVGPTSTPTPVLSPTAGPAPTASPTPTAGPLIPTPTPSIVIPPTSTPTPTVIIGNSPTPTATPVIISGLVANYKMDETAGVSVGDSTGSFNGTATGTTIVDGKSNKARSFNGQNDQVDVSSNFGIGTTNSSVAMWVNVPSVSDKGAFIKIGGKDTGFGIGVGNDSFSNSGNKLIMLYEYVRWIPTNRSIGTGWHHIAMVIDTTGVPTAYLDGQSVGTYPGVNTKQPLASTGIGGYLSGEGQRNFAGIIDEVQIYNRALSASEVANIYSGIINPAGNPSATPVLSPADVPTPTSLPPSSVPFPTATRIPPPPPTQPPFRCYSDSDCQQGWTCDTGSGSCYKDNDRGD